MGLGIPKDDQPFIRDGNVCKGIEICQFVVNVIIYKRLLFVKSVHHLRNIVYNESTSFSNILPTI